LPVAVLLTVAGLQVPDIPLLEVVCKIGAVVPLQIAAMALKVGVIIGLTVTVIDLFVAHCPAVGLNMYVPVVVLLTSAGFQVPVIELLEVVGKVGAVAPLQIGAMVANVGVIFGLTVIVILVGTTQVPDVGVNVYTPVVVLFTVVGLQIPVIPFVEVVGNIGAVAPLQIAGIVAKVGVIIGFTVINIVAVLAHKPAVGVKI
jgi:hypothetical protein